MAPVGIWRIEHPEDGEGPFRSIHEPGGLDAYDNIPGPRKDGLDYDRFLIRGDLGQDLVFGFADPKYLTRYFSTNDVKELHHSGFRVRQYLAPATAVMWGQTQVAFDRKSAVRARSLPVTTIHNSLASL